jgi:hypothetical protein
MLKETRKKSGFESKIRDEPKILMAIEEVQKDLQKEKKKYSYLFTKEYKYYI